MTEDTGLPASIEMVWGIRERPTKGPKRGLSLEQIVDAGVRVATADGIGGVSMSRVAGELGTSAMSLYRYVASKDELLWLMIDRAFGQVEATEPTEGTWRERMERWARIELTALRRFPWILRVPISGAPIMPSQLRFMEWGLSALSGTRLAADEKMSVLLLVTSYTRSFAGLSGDIAAAVDAGNPLAQTATGYGALIKKLTSAAEFPELHAVVDAGAFADEDDPADALDHDYRFGLDRIFDGVAALIQQR
ncbi:TetR/AcrR family transcriptional regulator [Actinophytocola sp.]|uniref:TetR/AcrR family transcriptional regulator n=1 Tax=Actinophytocola sp. TaxID=1872138 RepID=UPI002D51748E|nr:TetR/AcrR family transcriptional regulator [Actinophytocola sp.]HYQ69743.1 TetR/AcrR family transcriptional regulator [Actinophytocola sp.]